MMNAGPPLKRIKRTDLSSYRLSKDSSRSTLQNEETGIACCTRGTSKLVWRESVDSV